MNNPNVIGKIPDQQATYDDDENLLTETIYKPGFHVNTREPVEGWENYRMYPETFFRVYAGQDPVCYRFPDKETWQAERDAVFPTDLEETED